MGPGRVGGRNRATINVDEIDSPSLRVRLTDSHGLLRLAVAVGLAGDAYLRSSWFVVSAIWNDPERCADSPTPPPRCS